MSNIQQGFLLSPTLIPFEMGSCPLFLLSPVSDFPHFFIENMEQMIGLPADPQLSPLNPKSSPFTSLYYPIVGLQLGTVPFFLQRRP